MRQPNRAQWTVICFTAALLVLGWPPDRGSSLGVKALHWIVDPAQSLPNLPPPLPPGAGDNGDLVAAHDEIEAEYFRLYNSSSWVRWRMEMKDAGDPMGPATQRQWLVAIAVAAALLTWRLSASRSWPSA